MLGTIFDLYKDCLLGLTERRRLVVMLLILSLNATALIYMNSSYGIISIPCAITQIIFSGIEVATILPDLMIYTFESSYRIR